MTKRTERIVSIEEAVAVVKDGDTIGISGTGAQQEPMPLMRELLRRGVKDLTIIAMGAGMGIDMLIGAGRVKKVAACYMGMQALRPILYMFRDKLIKGELEFWECDFQHFDCALKCAHWAMPYMYTKAGLGTDITLVNTDLKEVEIDGEKWIQVPPFPVDVAFVYGHKVDPYGNVILNSSDIAERMVAEAASRAIIVCAEEIVPVEYTRRDPRVVVLGGPLRADYVVDTPWGAHPGESQGCYVADVKHVNEYLDAAEATITGENPQAFQRYLDKYVYGPKDHIEYLETIGGVRRLVELRQSML